MTFDLYDLCISIESGNNQSSKATISREMLNEKLLTLGLFADNITNPVGNVPTG